MGFLKRILGGKKQSSASLEESREIVGGYCSFLEHSAPLSGTVADVKKLPYSKTKIKEAIVICLKSISDSRTRETIKSAYIWLSNWQEGVGEENLGPDLRKIRNKDPMSIEVQRELEKYGEMENWSPIIEIETKELKAELERLGLW